MGRKIVQTLVILFAVYVIYGLAGTTGSQEQMNEAGFYALLFFGIPSILYVFFGSPE